MAKDDVQSFLPKIREILKSKVTGKIKSLDEKGLTIELDETQMSMVILKEQIFQKIKMNKKQIDMQWVKM